MAAAGAALVLLGMHNLWRYGGGLPMNAYPPPRYVERGIYRLLPHPIYVGFVMLCAGVSIAVRSASGFWLVSPIAALGCAALVLGYEKHDLAERFRSAPRHLLPEASASRPSSFDCLACYLFVFVPWLVLYEAVIALGVPRDATTVWLPFERRLPVRLPHDRARAAVRQELCRPPPVLRAGTLGNAGRFPSVYRRPARRAATGVHAAYRARPPVVLGANNG